ncbi:MAG: hypothetical protein QOD90_5216 [Mycobacterium sp.]|jgi:flavodoxin|nr:hypothetical protein [Mycobacterium sp.]
MTTLVINSSRSPHGNTRRVAEVIGAVLEAQVLTPAQVTPDALRDVQRIGFGSGIYWMGFDTQLVDLVHRLPDMAGHDAFVFATSGLPEPPFRRYTRTLGHLLEHKGFRVIGTFTCRGIDTVGPLRLLGGVNKTHPTDGDLAAARTFATQLTH